MNIPRCSTYSTWLWSTLEQWCSFT